MTESPTNPMAIPARTRPGISKPQEIFSQHQRSIRGPAVQPGLSVSQSSEMTMFVMTIYERAPIGALVRYHDLTP